jgi:hypothetical protein
MDPPPATTVGATVPLYFRSPTASATTPPGKVSVFGMDFETIYGESADYEFSREAPEGAPAGRG